MNDRRGACIRPGLAVRSVPVLLSIFVLLSGCGDTGPREVPAEGPATWEIDPDPVVVVGRTEGEEAFLFERVVSAHLLPGDRFLVADNGLGVLRVFDLDGSFVREMGRPGEGPGEFASLADTWVEGPDTVVAFDFRTYRLTSFLLDGTLLGTVRLAAEEGRPDMAVGELEDGSTLVAWLTVGVRRGVQGAAPDTMHFGRFAPDGEFVGWLGTELGMTRYVGEAGGGPTPFSPFPHHALWKDTVFYTNGRRPVVTVRSPDGEVVRTIGGPENPVDADAAWAALEDSIRAGEQEYLVARLEEVPRTDSIPHYAGMLVDDRGLIWLERYEPTKDAQWLGGWTHGSGGEWWVVDRDGRHVATVSMPPGFIPLEVRGDRMIGKTVDDLGVERVVVQRIGGRGPE